MEKKKALGEERATGRGFPLVQFRDCYDSSCSLQASSLGTYEEPGTSAVWLGCDDAKPQILASKAAAAGVQTEETTGWVPYPIPADVHLTTRMHLNREQVEALIAHLQAWLGTGHFTAEGLEVEEPTVH